MGFHLEGSFAGYGSLQTLIQKTKSEKAFGYENTHFSGENDIMDFNREKEQSLMSKNTLVLPVTNYTYDIYSIQGQGVGGTFRPFRGQIGYVHEPKVSDISASMSMGAEYEGGAGGHIGGNIKRSYSNSMTRGWNTTVVPFFKEKISNNDISYETVYLKNIGENRIDQEYQSLFDTKIGAAAAITLQLDGNKQATNKYLVKAPSLSYGNSSPFSSTLTFNSQLKRNKREDRNQVIQKFTKKEVEDFGMNSFIKSNVHAKPHHTAGYVITDEKGNRHIFGETAYNESKKEVTFAVNTVSDPDNDGIVLYSPGSDNSPNNHRGIDHYFNRITTPEYAHTYLLSSVLSGDYEDLSADGPTDDDLGTYTKIIYSSPYNYNWRIPYKKNSASFNEGFKSDPKDQKASYIYGEKEIKYATKIISKTHVAFIDLEDRKDGRGTLGENGGNGSKYMKKITSIRLYSKSQLQNEQDPGINNASVRPIKAAHFVYDYSLCQGIDNNSGVISSSTSEINNQGGKLTLKKVYFTYGNSNMGKYTPYIFNYEGLNPNYNPKAYDIWGNYKPLLDASSGLTAQEFPYVEQGDQQQQNEYSSAWSLTSIELPSGGKIKLTYESDDYQFVQDKRALQMFKVEGVCTAAAKDNFSASSITNELYGTNGEAKYVVVKVNDEDVQLPDSTILEKYIGELEGKPIYFNFFMKIKKSGTVKDFVTGYFEMDQEAVVRSVSADTYLLVPMKHLNKEGKDSQSSLVNPISLAGWFFGRKYLQDYIYTNNPSDLSPTNIFSIGQSLINNLGAMVEIFRGPNGRLRDLNCAQNFEPVKSWVRLQEPSGTKFGGGSRIKTVEMFDGWNDMVGVDENDPNIDIQRYLKKYGQEYDYNLDDGSSSGVATYEPNICKENPLIQPFYHKPEKMSAQAYEEKPFGESFYPTPTVTYKKVRVKNVTASDDDDTTEVRNTKTGEVVTTFYTSYDFPTRSSFTTLDNPLTKYYRSNENDMIKNIVKGLLGLKIEVNIDLTMTQGFSVETNDMNGKMRKQEVYNNAGDIISMVEYKYNVDENDPSTLVSELVTIDENGEVSNTNALGMHYDVINDFRESYSYSNVNGVSGNIDYLPFIFPIVIGYAVPERSQHTQILRTAVTTKVIHKTGILVEKIAHDLGSRVSTKNLAWDANTGQVVLTQTVNEFDDKYYAFNYPAYWYYKAMGMASNNIDIKGMLEMVSGSTEANFSISGNGAPSVEEVFNLGDELIISFNVSGGTTSYLKFWVSSIQNGEIQLMNRNGNILDASSLPSNEVGFKVIRSGKRNQQMASMASITLMADPILLNPDGTGNLNEQLITYNGSESDNPFIVNASAIEYSDEWESQCERNLPNASGLLSGTIGPVNPYVYNIKGDWRAKKSYAYLTGRNSGTTVRNSGFYKNFSPFYSYNGTTNVWEVDATDWTFASEVSKYSPYGMEVENKDALNRYSSAQYGYGYTLPVAVSSNAMYQEIGFDGFEDYSINNFTTPQNVNSHFGFNGVISTDAYITNKKSHSGKNAIVVKANTTVEYKKRIAECESTN
ncbi:hypothetical protein DI487_10150 [Flavobacterium sediminis]|uniref:PA14 domain-containing protein n=1 Tax=Flavobacterium sediminis TaxID=2201181 RepID=A0A2U8QVL9_9FLAO|nr:hypothetical protein [Flavobacterium sediminis]AWM14173.1 hypothetical protein DI487_10150 [Flavobacterium sediminis]